MTCDGCDKRGVCVELCEDVERELGKVTNQDVWEQGKDRNTFIVQPENIPDDVVLQNEAYPGLWPQENTKSEKQIMAEMYFLDGKTEDYIAKQMTRGQATVSRVVRKVKDYFKTL